MICCATACFSQDSLFIPPSDTAFYYYRICKQPEAFLIPYPVTKAKREIVAGKDKVKKEAVAVNGELGYQRFSRSSPSDDLLLINSSSDIVTFQAGIIFHETYPVTLRVRYNDARPFQMDNQYEVSLSFDERNFRQILQDKIKANITKEYFLKQQRLIADHDQLFQQYQAQKQYLQGPVYMQQAFEEKMKAAAGNGIPDLPQVPDVNDLKRLPGSLVSLKKKDQLIDSALNKVPGIDKTAPKADSIVNSLLQKKETLQSRMEHKRDSLEQLVQKVEDSIGRVKEKFQRVLDSVNNEMAAMTNPEQLQEYARKKKILDSLPQKRWPSLLMKSSIRFGKFIMSQSELTVNNIFISGSSIKYGNEKFIMFSGGAYDFAFRGLFNFRNDTNRSRIPTVFAMKMGVTDGKNLTALNFYMGKKSRDASLTSELRTVAGFSIEKKIELNRNFSAAVELAKSTTRDNTAGSREQQVIKDLVTSFNTKTIGLYGSVKGYFPKTRTDAEVTYKYWGQQFESFNASQYFNPQNNLSAKLSQPFFKRKLYAAAGIRYTDFSTYGVASNIHSKTLFASANMTLRLKRMPVVSVGYYPGSQLYMVDQNKLYEYYYYVLNSTVSHQFNLLRLPMQGVFSYNKFFNKYSDSLVSSSNSAYNFYWTAWKGRFTWMANFSRQEMDLSLLKTIEAGLSYNVNRFKIGGSLKWNHIDQSTEYGYAANFGWSVRNLGTISLLYDRSYLPDRAGIFIPVQTAQLQFIKPLNFKIWQ